MREPQKTALGLWEQRPPPAHSRRRKEGAVGIWRVQKDSGLSPKVQSRGPSFPLQTPFSGPRALGLGTSLHLVKFEEGVLEKYSPEDKV